MAFEVAVVDKESLKSFLEEVNEKHEYMVSFKRQYTKFVLATELYLKKGDNLPVHTHPPGLCSCQCMGP